MCIEKLLNWEITGTKKAHGICDFPIRQLLAVATLYAVVWTSPNQFQPWQLKVRSRTGCNRFFAVYCRYQILSRLQLHLVKKLCNCNQKSGCRLVRSGSVPVFFRSYGPDFQTLNAIVELRRPASFASDPPTAGLGFIGSPVQSAGVATVDNSPHTTINAHGKLNEEGSSGGIPGDEAALRNHIGLGLAFQPTASVVSLLF